MSEVVEMSIKELNRLKILQKVLDNELKQKAAGKILKVSDRQIRTLLTRLKSEGPKGIISRKRGRANHQKSQEFKQKVLSLVKNKYEDCGPTLIKEKLEEWHNITLSSETLRLWMISSHLWFPKQRKRSYHLPRNRRNCFGELIQADGSHHKWFGEDGPMVNLTVMIDDATSKLTSLVFSEGETTESYFQALEQHIAKYGRPIALYTDRFSVFQSNNQKKMTHFQIALKKLDIDLIFANSPQAKGRVERANRTLQDRLVKELRWRGIKTTEEANKFVKDFIDTYNQKFSKEPISKVDAHRPLEGYELKRLLCRQETRTLLSDCTFQFKKQLFKIQGISDIRRTKGKKVEIREIEGKMKVYLEDKEMQISKLSEIEGKVEILNRKEVLWRIPQAKNLKNHPWKKYGYQLSLKNKIQKSALMI